LVDYRGRLELTWTNKDQVLISTGEGRYDYEWVHPSDFRANEIRLTREIDRVAAPDGRPEGSPLPAPTEDNLLFSGDALHVLDILAKVPEYAEQYAGKIKLVYIDPPFNTKQAFQHYEDNLEHSVWLTMLRDRLKQVVPLLAPDASVWVHLDDSEVHRMRMVLDEELGIGNHVASVIWRSADTGNYDDSKFSGDHNTLLIYSLNPDWAANGLPRTVKQAKHYANPDGDPRGPWFDGNPLGSPNPRENLMYDVESHLGITIKHPPHGWRWQRSTFDEMLESGAIRYSDDGKRVIYRTYLWEQGDLPPSTLWDDVEETGSNRKAKNELKALFGLPAKQVFDTPKPERLMERIIRIATEPGEIVLDFFAGSGTTAAVAHKMGRRWVTAELNRSTISTFTRVRLDKVIRGEDPGGITTTTSLEAVNNLPAGIMASEAKAFGSMLTKFAKRLDTGVAEDEAVDETTGDAETEEDESDIFADQALADLVKKLKAQARTRSVKTQNWHGGGSYRLIVVGPSMFEAEDGVVYLADWVRGGHLSAAVAAQTGFRFDTDPYPWCGTKGRRRLAVIDGTVDASLVEHLQGHLADGESATIYATSIDPAARAALRRGCTLQKVPTAILESYHRSTRRGRSTSSQTTVWAADLTEGAEQ
jgi:adenine-specific DNA-methyltransferase